MSEASELIRQATERLAAERRRQEAARAGLVEALRDQLVILSDALEAYGQGSPVCEGYVRDARTVLAATAGTPSAPSAPPT